MTAQRNMTMPPFDSSHNDTSPSQLTNELCLSDIALTHRSSFMTRSSNLTHISLHVATSTWSTPLSHNRLYKCRDQWIEDCNLSVVAYINLCMSLLVTILLQIDGGFIQGHMSTENKYSQNNIFILTHKILSHTY